MERAEPTDDFSVRWVLSGAVTVAVVSALLVSSQIQLSMYDHGHDWWRLFAWQLVGWGYWCPFAPWLLRVGGGLLRSRHSLWWLRLAATGLGLTMLHLPLVAGAFTLLQPYLPVDIYPFSDGLMRSFRSWFHIDLLIFCMGLVIGYGLAGLRQARQAELRESQLETELARAQLESLRLQIQPHFLFNTLNSIAALVRRKSNDRALEMVLGLSDLLRSTLERSEHSVVPLAEELDFVKRYVDLQHARFADRLTVDYDVGEGCADRAVPSFVLQPLVENAIRHGIARRAAPGRIDIRARLEGEQLVLTVTDDGVGLPKGFSPETEGVGLSNTRSRIRQLYGEDAELRIDSRQGGGVVAVVSLPVVSLPVEREAASALRAAAG